VKPKVKNYRLQDLLLEAKEKVSASIVVVLLILILIALSYFIVLYQFKNYPKTYKGKVIDKRVSIRETMFGTKISEVIILQGEDGKKIGVFVNGEEYDNTEIGEYIENHGNGVINLSKSQNNESDNYQMK
jgi:hypothetical protein